MELAGTAGALLYEGVVTAATAGVAADLSEPHLRPKTLKFDGLAADDVTGVAGAVGVAATGEAVADTELWGPHFLPWTL
jgi:hypothetical protein